MSTVADRVAVALGDVVAAQRPLAGGSINRAVHLRLGDGRELFVKHRDPAPAGMFTAEARGLRWLAGAEAVRLPRVVAVDEDWLALEWIPQGRPAADHDERLGRGLAHLHRFGAPAFGDPEGRDGFIGPLRLPGGPRADWPAFLAEQRLMPLGAAARDAGAFTDADVRDLERLCAGLPERLGPAEPPARLHGDLWAGNAYPDAGGAPVLVDPAAFGGHREVDLAMMRLFGGFSPRVFAAYREVHPLAPGAQDRVALNQLVPLLVHAALFGGGYVAQARELIARNR